MSAQGFFYAILPLLEESKPLGHLEMDTSELSEYFDVSVTKIRMYVYELKKHKILKPTRDGDMVCPLLIRLRCVERP